MISGVAIELEAALPHTLVTAGAHYYGDVIHSGLSCQQRREQEGLIPGEVALHVASHSLVFCPEGVSRGPRDTPCRPAKDALIIDNSTSFQRRKEARQCDAR